MRVGHRSYLLIVPLFEAVDALIPTKYKDFDFAVSIRYVEHVIGCFLE